MFLFEYEIYIRSRNSFVMLQLINTETASHKAEQREGQEAIVHGP